VCVCVCVRVCVCVCVHAHALLLCTHQLLSGGSGDSGKRVCVCLCVSHPLRCLGDGIRKSNTAQVLSRTESDGAQRQRRQRLAPSRQRLTGGSGSGGNKTNVSPAGEDSADEGGFWGLDSLGSSAHRSASIGGLSPSVSAGTPGGPSDGAADMGAEHVKIKRRSLPKAPIQRSASLDHVGQEHLREQQRSTEQQATTPQCAAAVPQLSHASLNDFEWDHLGDFAATSAR
jgi:hypothetical protein